MTSARLLCLLVLTILLALLPVGAAQAEPYLAVRSGLPCGACHVNPTGGGSRTAVGSQYGLGALPQEPADPAAPATWSGQLAPGLRLGADLRATAQSVRTPGSPTTPGSTITLGSNPLRGQVYLDLAPLGERLAVHVDQRFAPGAAANREAWLLLWMADHRVYVKAGRLFVPFGLRVEDDSAYVRQVTGVNFNASDDGVEAGVDLGAWSGALSITNGNGGADENNRGKLLTALLNHVQPLWRAGLSASVNQVPAADRRMVSAFGGVRTGWVSWLGSVVVISDELAPPAPHQRQRVALLEGNAELARGHNLKLGWEFHDPDTRVREDQRVRYSAVWEYTPLPYTQLRVGARKADGIPQNPAQNTTELFAQWHAYF
ncbi:MAG: hypothetical protein RLZZ584_3521 [Pseudomonadota bacterium]